ncbi:MAG: molybdopterin cofactor-binding domain-containing protein, partial [Myxococcota bacterium]
FSDVDQLVITREPFEYPLTELRLHLSHYARNLVWPLLLHPLPKLDPAGGFFEAGVLLGALFIALAISTAESLGKNADEIETGEVALFENLKLVGGFEMQKDNPRWTPVIWNSTKASSGSSRWVHAVEQACLVLLETGMLPAARSLWGSGANGIKASDVRWANGQLEATGLAPVPLGDLAKRMHEKGFAVSSMVHAFHSGRWITANYTVGDVTRRWEIDALAVQLGGSKEWKLIDRQDPELYTAQDMWMKDGQTLGATGALAAVMVNRRTGEPRVVGGVHFAAPGKIIQRDLVEGQMEGQWAMGIGHALLEYLPPSADGAADGTWNLNRYHVPLARDCALDSTEKVIFPPESPDAPARGMGEVPLLPVPPAIANAIAHATGKRFRDLPITPKKIRAEWS